MSSTIDEIYQDTVNSSTDTVIIPDAGPFFFTVFSGGGQVASSGNSKIELYWDQSGVGTNMKLIDAIYSTGETHDRVQNQNIFYDADGTARIVVRRKLLGGSARELYARVQGFVA